MQSAKHRNAEIASARRRRTRLVMPVCRPPHIARSAEDPGLGHRPSWGEVIASSTSLTCWSFARSVPVVARLHRRSWSRMERHRWP
jgi:hypothetical protein